MEKFLKGYKGFNTDFTCKNKQYEENTVFEEKEAVICNSGMHFFTNPFDVLDYYDLVNENGSFNEFANVEAQESAFTNDDKKFCTTKLKIGVKLGFTGFIKACVDFILEKTKVEENENNELSSGDSAQIGSSGDSAKIGSSGYYAKIGSSGYSAKIGSSGDSAKIGSSGDSAKIGSSGYYAQIGSSGDSAQINSTGKDAVIMCAGVNSIAKAKKGSWITLAEWVRDEEKERYIPKCVKTEFVDGEKIKEDTYYKLIDCEFQAVK